jgi:hypothetical protein
MLIDHWKCKAPGTEKLAAALKDQIVSSVKIYWLCGTIIVCSVRILESYDTLFGALKSAGH